MNEQCENCGQFKNRNGICQCNASPDNIDYVSDWPIGIWLAAVADGLWNFPGPNYVVIEFRMTDKRDMSCYVCTNQPSKEREQWRKERVFVKRWMILPL